VLKSVKKNLRRKFGPIMQTIGYETGLMRLTNRIRQEQGAIILMYHSVADDTLSPWIDPANHVPADVFVRQMAFLVAQRQVIALDEMVAELKQGKTPPAGTIVITFDDGYLDNLTVAAPILDHYGLPATLFLPTGYIDRGESQWVDQAYSAFKFRGKSKLFWGTEVKTAFDFDNLAQYNTGYLVVCKELLRASSDERRAMLNRLYEQLQPSALPPRLTMNWDEARTLLNNHHCFRIGGHTVEHTDLSSVPGAQAQKELTSCAKRIKEELGTQPRHFSFCYGRTSESLRRQAAEAGFDSACGGEGIDPVIRSMPDILRLPRVAGPASMERFDLVTSSLNTGFWRRLGR